MSKLLVSDALWTLIAPLLPPEHPKPKGGRPPSADRAALTGILFVLQSGIPWEMLPQELGCGSGMTCWRRLRDWQQVGCLETPPPSALAAALRRGTDRLGAGVTRERERAGSGGAKRPARIQPSAASWAPSATSWSTGRDCRWQ